MAMELESTHGMDGCRRFYESDLGPLTVEITECTHERGRTGDLMGLWVKHGWMPEFIERTLHVSTYFHEEDGGCLGIYNPQIKDGVSRPVIDFRWMLEATPENEAKLLAECERRMLADNGERAL